MVTWYENAPGNLLPVLTAKQQCSLNATIETTNANLRFPHLITCHCPQNCCTLKTSSWWTCFYCMILTLVSPAQKAVQHPGSVVACLIQTFPAMMERFYQLFESSGLFWHLRCWSLHMIEGWCSEVHKALHCVTKETRQESGEVALMMEVHFQYCKEAAKCKHLELVGDLVCIN